MHEAGMTQPEAAMTPKDRKKVCLGCGVELSFKEICGTYQLCFVCDRQQAERDNTDKVRMGNESEQLGLRINADLTR